MANVFLFFKKPRSTQIIRKVGSQLTSVVLDATVKETFTSTAEATVHPIEAGADVTDHVILKPDGLSLSGIITETPLGDFPGSLIRVAGASAGAAIGSSLGRFAGPVGASGGVLGAIGGGLLAKTIASSIFGSNDRVLTAVVTEFKKVRDAKQTVNIQTGLRLYENFILTSFSANRDQKTGGSIRVDLEFKEVIIAESRESVVAIPKIKGALAKTSQGAQSKGDLDSDTNKKGASILKKLFGGAS